jgi:hypothetical protein
MVHDNPRALEHLALVGIVPRIISFARIKEDRDAHLREPQVCARLTSSMCACSVRAALIT